MQNNNLPGGGVNNSPFNQHQSTQMGKSKKSIPVLPVLLVVIVILQLVSIFLTVSPPYLQQQNLTNQIVAEVSEKAQINPFENPIVSQVADADSLRKANAIQAEVYKDAQNGDYVIGFSDKMIIYRRESGEIIYEGESPGVILNKNQQQLTQSILQAVVDANLIEQDDEVNPQLSVITDPKVLKEQDAAFYANAKEGDIIAIFPNKQLIVLARNSEGKVTIIQSGSYNTSITAN